MSCNRPRAPLCLRAGIPEAGRRAVPSRVPVHLQRHMGGARTTAPPPPEGSAGGPPCLPMGQPKTLLLRCAFQPKDYSSVCP